MRLPALSPPISTIRYHACVMNDEVFYVTHPMRICKIILTPGDSFQGPFLCLTVQLAAMDNWIVSFYTKSLLFVVLQLSEPDSLISYFLWRNSIWRVKSLNLKYCLYYTIIWNEQHSLIRLVSLKNNSRLWLFCNEQFSLCPAAMHAPVFV